LRFGLDIGSISLCAIVLDNDGNIIYCSSIRHQGDPIGAAISEILMVNSKFDSIGRWGITGSGAQELSRRLNAPFINEFSAISNAVGRLIPEARTIFEMGGQQAKYIHLSPGKSESLSKLDDFAASGLCAAGTGSFLDQQAARLGINIEDEFGVLALKSTNPPHIAGRCSVFAKSDMIHHQQRGVPVYDIIAGLCYAVARNFKGTIVKSRQLNKPVVFLGGVASNPGVVRAFKDVLGLNDSEFIVPNWHKAAGAIGAAFLSTPFSVDVDKLTELGHLEKSAFASKMPRSLQLRYSSESTVSYEQTRREEQPRSDINCGYMGIDIGSLSTNVVLISENCEVISRRYLMTAGRPIEAVQQGLREIRDEIACDFEVLGVATTGSGRYLIGELVGADLIRNEITAQATGGIHFVPDADTIFEIGGQDSKFISLENGAVVDFEMNRACAAGTGSFLEEQAERLGIKIKSDFAALALDAEKPVACGERCTVFIESDILKFEQGGASKEEITAGLAYGVVHNYLNKVVGRKRVGEKILFQGGVAWNKAVVAAFETVTGKKIIVPPHHDVTGAIGAAILVRDNKPQKSNFKGFGLADRKIEQETFLCQDCANLCNITRINDSGRELYYGSRCEKYDVKREAKSDRLNLLAQRNRKILFTGAKSDKSRGMTVGLPRALSNWEFMFFWKKFLAELGFEIIISKESSGEIIKQGVESVGSETCFPVKVAHGHLIDLAKRQPDFIFLPAVVTGLEPAPKGTSNYFCPYIQAFPFIAKASIKELNGIDIVSPIVRFGEGTEAVAKTLHASLKRFGVKKSQIISAMQIAFESFANLKKELVEIGSKHLQSISPSNPGILLVGRPYNSLDPGVSMDVAEKLTSLGVTVIPMDMVKLSDDHYDFIYWQSGRRILRAAQLARETPGLYPVYISNFGCGPDSFILHHFKKVMGDKPHLVLELDEHSADAGLITRCEAFLDSLPKSDKKFATMIVKGHSNGFKRKMLIPYMCDHAQLFAAALRNCGLDSEVLGETDERSLEIGRRLTGGRECYPAVLTTGDIVRELEKPGTDPNKISFFMPTAGGPCRFGQYQRLHQQILQNIGYGDVMIYSPTSDDAYSSFPQIDKTFRRLAWRGFVATDYMRKFLLRTRPYEKTKGEADKAYGHFLDLAVNDVELGGKNLPEILRDSFDANSDILDKSLERNPRVGVIGEIYIRNNRYANNDLVAKLESVGLEVDLSTMCEWIYYTTEEVKGDSWRKRAWKEFLGASLQDIFQHKDEHWIISPILEDLDGHRERPIKDILNLVEPYLPISVGGEAMPAMGKAIDMIKHGCSGIANTLPFTCMPGNIINAISTSIVRDHGGFPWLNMAYEGIGGENDLVRIGAFAESVRAWKGR
jgi:predicted CoA-substrate-specific enzyme activase